jgi:hypothetical protein
MSCESTHPNKPIDIEYQSENKLTARHAVEEAMTSAFVRECNHCHRPFVKEEGCNKMKCSCGNAQCFVCSLDVTDYNHFDKKDASGNPLQDSCPLYEDTTVRLRQEVAAAQKRAVHQVREDRPELTEDDVIVDKKIVVPGEAAVAPLVPLVPGALQQQNDHDIYAPNPIPFPIERQNLFLPPAPLLRAINVEPNRRRRGQQQEEELFAVAVGRRRNHDRREREAQEAREVYEPMVAQAREEEVIRREEEPAEMERQAAQQRELEALARLREGEDHAHELELARMRRARQELEGRMQEEQAEAVRVVEQQERRRREREQNARLEQQAQEVMNQARREYVRKHNRANDPAGVETERQVIQAMALEQQVVQRAPQSRKRAEEVLKKAKKEPKQRRKEAELRARQLATEITEQYNQERRDAEKRRDEAIDRARLAGVKVGKYEKQVLESNRKSKSFWKW